MLTTDEIKPLHPLESGNVLIIGIRPGILDDEIRTNPRVTIWDGEQEHWTNKDIPHNVRAIFFTRFIGHSLATRLIKDARRRHITIFNGQGTGVIVRQVKELITMPVPTPIITKEKDVVHTFEWTRPQETIKETIVTQLGPRNKMAPLKALIDWSKTNTENFNILWVKAQELGIQTTKGSVSQMIVVEKRKMTAATKVARVAVQAKKETLTKTSSSSEKLDVLDLLVKELQDMRAFLADTIAENTMLKARIEKFKKALDND